MYLSGRKIELILLGGLGASKDGNMGIRYGGHMVEGESV